MIVSAFKDILAIGLASDIPFKQLTQAQSASAHAPAHTSAATAGGAKGAAKAPEPEPEKEEEVVSMGGLFD